MDNSINIETENVSRKRRLQIVGTRDVIEGLQATPTRIPGAIGSVALPHELRGFNEAGEYVTQDYHEHFDPPPAA